MALSQTYDPFASIDFADAGGDEFQFDDTYDGLADQLLEHGDDFNDETFGSVADVRKDFDFSSGRGGGKGVGSPPIAKPSSRQPAVAPSPPNVRSRPPPPPPASVWNGPQQFNTQAAPAPMKGPIPDLQPAASLWQTGPSTQGLPEPNSEKKFLSLEEVEAQILAASRPSPQNLMPQEPQAYMRRASPDGAMQPSRQPLPPQANRGFQGMIPSPAPLQSRPPMDVLQPHEALPVQRSPVRAPQPAPPGLSRPPFPDPGLAPTQQRQHHQFEQPKQQMRDNTPGFGQQLPPPPQPPVNNHMFERILSRPREAVQPLNEVMKEEHSRSLEEENKRIRHLQKLNALSRDNGLMSPSDKNYITRIQLQQLITEDPYAEDFYYQVYSAIRMRNHPQQPEPVKEFTQTYVIGRGGRGRQQSRKENPLQRMQQQVQRAVAAAKARPRATQLALEGALGKISFKSVKNPRQVLKVKKSDSNLGPVRKSKTSTASETKQALKTIENVYGILLELEEADRVKPKEAGPGEEEDLALESWRAKIAGLAEVLWTELKVMAPIDPESSQMHPFIAIFQYPKGMRLMPRIFRQVDLEQRLTIATMLIAHLETLDVVKLGIISNPDGISLRVREHIDTFTQTVLPSLLSYITDAPMPVIVGLLGILMEQNDVVFISQSRTGLMVLTMLISRAEISRQAGEFQEQETQWSSAFQTLFTTLEGHFLSIFPSEAVPVNDVYVWQFLASMAVGASMEQQHTMVAEVRDKVLDNVISSKSLPEELATQKITNTNLFLHAMGLDTEQLGV